MGFDDEEEVRGGEAGGEKLLARFVEGFGQDGKNNFALGASYEMEAKLFVNELELSGHSCCAIVCASGSIHRIGKEIKGKVATHNRNVDLYQFGTDAAEGKIHGLEIIFATEGEAAQAKSAH